MAPNGERWRFVQRSKNRPPENRAGNHETQVLKDVKAFVGERSIEQHGNMPGQHRAHAQQPGDRRLADGAFQFSMQGRRSAASQRRRAEQHQRRNHKCEQEMLETCALNRY